MRVSVLTATYNAVSTIRTLFNSLEAQDDKNFEWIVVDGQSEDGTAEFLSEISLSRPWITWISERDFGFYDALNKALHLCTGEYYLVVGADDSLLPSTIGNFIRAATESGADIVTALVRKNNRIYGGFYPSRRWLGHAQVFRGSHSVGMLIRKSLHNSLGLYDSRFPLLADGYFLKRVLDTRTLRIHSASFLAGDFSEHGMTGNRAVQVIAETWHIQVLTERSIVIQTLLMIARLVAKYPQIAHEVKRHKSRAVAE